MTTAIYDGYCVLCIQTKRIVTALDWLHRVEFLDLHNWNEVHTRYPDLDYDAAMGQMHVVTPDGRMTRGFEAVHHMLRDLPLGFPFWLILRLPGMNGLGSKVYRLIAHSRYRINRFFGSPVCEDGICKMHG